MPICYWEITDADDAVKVPLGKGPMRVIDDVDPVRLARGILDESGAPGWTCKVWIQGGMFPLPDGEPDATVSS